MKPSIIGPQNNEYHTSDGFCLVLAVGVVNTETGGWFRILRQTDRQQTSHYAGGGRLIKDIRYAGVRFNPLTPIVATWVQL